MQQTTLIGAPADARGRHNATAAVFAWRPLYVVVPVFLGFLFAWLGISASGQWPLAVAIVVWTSVVFVDWITAGVATALLGKSRWFARWPLWAALLLGLALSKIAAVPLNHFIGALVAAAGLPLQPDRSIESSVLTAIVPQAAVWVAAIYLVRAIMTAPAEQPAPPPAANEPRQQGLSVVPSFVAKMRPPQRGTVVAVRAEQHYIRVFTDVGEDLVLYKFGDAVRELGLARGLQVHRSWWVARESVVGFAREGRDWLSLTGGLEAPIGRTYLREARALVEV